MKTTKIFSLYFLVFALIFTVSCPTITNSFAANSFSQTPGEGFIWEVKIADTLAGAPEVSKVGDRLKIEILSACYGKQPCCGFWGDTLSGDMYNNSIANRLWTLLKSNYMFSLYNSSTEMLISYGYFFIPHNETIVNFTLYEAFNMTWNYQTYNWTSGLHGYDGIAQAYNGSMTGDLNQSKREFHYNADGVLKRFVVYNGTGSGWTIIYNVELIESFTFWIFDIGLTIIISLMVVCGIIAVIFLWWGRKSSPTLERVSLRKKQVKSS